MSNKSHSKQIIELSSRIAFVDDQSADDLVSLANEVASEEDRTEALVDLLSNDSRLNALGMHDHTYIVGGAVRDIVLGYRPKDVDIVVDTKGLEETDSKGKTPLDFGKAIASIVPGLPENKVVEDNFFVVHVGPFPMDFYHNGVNLKGSKIEIVRARSEKYQKGKGYKPTEVEPGTLEQDIARRDFTINTLAMSLSEASKGMESGEIVDLTEKGLEDLKKKPREVNRDLESGMEVVRSPRKSCLLRTPLDPYETFDEDPSRILRAIRFAFKYGCEIDSSTRKAMADKASELKRIPWEPVADIFVNKILTQPYAMPALTMMKGLGIFDVLIEISNENQGFRTFLSRQIRNYELDADAPLMLELASMGLSSVKTPASGLSQQELRRVKKVLPEHGDILSRVSRPSINMMEVAQRSGLHKKEVGKVRPVVKRLMLEHPELSNEEIMEIAVDHFSGQGDNVTKEAQVKRVYAAIFLTPESRERLLKAYPPQHPQVFAEHFTVAFGGDMKARMEELEPLVGQEFTLRVTGYAQDDQGQAVKVATSPPLLSSNAHGHITISTANGVRPVYSNQLLSSTPEGEYEYTPETLQGVFDFYPRTEVVEEEEPSSGTAWVFDFDDTLMWAPEWYSSVKTNQDGIVTNPGDSFAVRAALRFIQNVNEDPKLEVRKEYRGELPNKFFGMFLKEFTINKPEAGRDGTKAFRLMGSDGSPISMDELKKYFSNSRLKRASIDVRGRYVDFPAVTDDAVFYQSPSTLGTLGVNPEMMSLFKQHNDSAYILTARKDTPGTKARIIELIVENGGRQPIETWTNEDRRKSSVDHKTDKLIRLLLEKDRVVMFDDNQRYLSGIIAGIKEYDEENGTELSKKLELHLVDKSKKPE